MGLGPRLALTLSSTIASVWPRAFYFLSRRTLAPSHGRTINPVPYCLFPVHIGQSPCPAKRRWRYERNFERFVGVNRTTHPRRPKVVAWPKSLWDRCVTYGHLLRYFMGCLSDRVLSDIMNTSA